MRAIRVLRKLCYAAFIGLLLAGHIAHPDRSASAASKSALPFVLRLRAPDDDYLALWNGMYPILIAYVPSDFHWGNPSMSPDGDAVAYTSYVPKPPQKTTNADIPTDIYIIKFSDLKQSSRLIPTEVTYHIEQPVDAKLSQTPRRFIVRSDPVWSTGGDSIYWVEYTADEEAKAKFGRLKGYSLNSKKERLLSDEIPLQEGAFRLGSLQLSKDGFLYSTADTNGRLRILVYTTGGKQRYAKTLSAPGEAVWLQAEDSLEIGVALTSKESPTRLKRIDYRKDALYDFEGTLTLANPAVTGSASVRRVVTTPKNSTPEVVSWLVSVTGTSRVCDKVRADQVFAAWAIAIAPDGYAVGCVSEEGSLILTSREAVQTTLNMRVFGPSITPIVGIAWGTSVWQFES